MQSPDYNLVAAGVFALLALFWTPRGWFNLLCKGVMTAMTIWGVLR